MATTWDGGCLCGGLRYRLAEAPRDVNDCHCIDCRRASGAPFVRWGAIRSETVEVLSGGLRIVNHAQRVRSFAACCGTPVIFQRNAGDEWIDVAIATLDDPMPFQPGISIWTEDRLPGVPIDPEVPSFKQSSRPPGG